MATQNDDRGAKPYKTYKASSRPRRSQLDDELAGARPARRRPSDHDGSADRAYPPRSDKAYQTYGPAPGSKAAKKAAKKNATRGGAPKRKRRFRWWHVPVTALALLIIAGVVLTVLAWPGYQKFDRAVDKANKRVDKKTSAQLTADDGWIWRKGTTVLLLGLDEAAWPAHSDTIMLMRFDPGAHKVNTLSIPRDTLVNVDGYGQQKLTQAMWYGGPSLAVKTVKQFTGIPINHVMVVGFQGFPRLVNSVGGIDFYVPQTVTTGAGPGIPGETQRTVTFEKGMHHFDGKNAMLYVRIRKAYIAGGDFTRAARQQAFMQALQKKLTQPGNVTKLPEIGKHFMSGVSTDLTTNEILQLAYLKWRANGGKKQVMKGAFGWYEGQAVVLPPSESARQKMVDRFLGD
jgi:LCP family protein required for cell wall assembly